MPCDSQDGKSRRAKSSKQGGLPMNEPRRRFLAAMIALLLLGGSRAAASDWPGWRGPTGLGYWDEKNLPLTWNAKTGENIVWKALLHGGTKNNEEMTQPGWSCPIVWKDRVFITTCIYP